MALFFKVLFVLFLLLLCCALCVPVYASNTDQPETEKKTAELFNLATLKKDVQDHSGGKINDGDVNFTKINFPLFVVVKKNVIIAVAEANYTKTSDVNTKIGVVARYFEGNRDKWENQVFTNLEQNWKTQLTTKSEDAGAEWFSAIRTSAVTTSEHKIYVFLLNITDQPGKEWKFKVVEGTVNGEAGKPITWETKEVNNLETFKEKMKNLKQSTVGSATSDGSAFLTKNKNILLVVKGKSENDKQNVTAFIQLKESRDELEKLDVEITEKCYLTFFQWKGEIFKIPAENTEEGQNKMMEFSADSKTFVQTNNSITRLHYFLKEKNNFLNATIADKDVLLFTQQRDVKSDSKKNVYLWMTDGTRVSCAGTIFSDGFTGTSYESLLYTNNELFALHQTSETPAGGGVSDKIELTLLKKQLENIKKTLTAWNKSKNEIEKPYKDTPTKTQINFDDGIVGFLSGNKDNNNWEDGYLYANAVVTINKDKGSATRENNGFKFTGTGAGGQWSVSKAPEDQPYNFIDTGFTLVATVTVGSGTNDGDNSVLGVGLTGTTNKVGLWCTTNGKWTVKVVKNDQTNIPSSDINCTRNEKYYVAIILNSNKNNKIFFLC